MTINMYDGGELVWVGSLIEYCIDNRLDLYDQSRLWDLLAGDGRATVGGGAGEFELVVAS